MRARLKVYSAYSKAGVSCFDVFVNEHLVKSRA